MLPELKHADTENLACLAGFYLGELDQTLGMPYRGAKETAMYAEVCTDDAVTNAFFRYYHEGWHGAKQDQSDD